MNEVCQNGGVCVSKWNTHSCDCPTGYGGKNCEQGEKCVNVGLFLYITVEDVQSRSKTVCSCTGA